MSAAMKTLHLTLHSEYFNQILNGTKKEEYRDIKPFWEKRLVDGFKTWEEINNYYEGWIPSARLPLTTQEATKNEIKHFDTVTFKNGYSKNAPTMVVECLGLDVGINIKTPLGTRNFFVIKLGKILETRNLKC